jgi:hypothetical protein
MTPEIKSPAPFLERLFRPQVEFWGSKKEVCALQFDGLTPFSDRVMQELGQNPKMR